MPVVLGGQALEYDRIGVTAIAGDHQFARVWQRLAKLLDAGERDDIKPLLFFLLRPKVEQERDRVKV